MPLPWPPKLFIDKEKFLKGSPMGEVTRFYKKSRIDVYTKYLQIDGLTTRMCIYEDYNRTLIKEIRCLYSNRQNNLIVRQRFPFENRTIEYYKPNFKPNYRPSKKSDTINLPWPHWRRIEEIDRRMRTIDYYHYRHEDGLIKRIDELDLEWVGNHERINETKEIFEGRDDWLVYRAFRYYQKNNSSDSSFAFKTSFSFEAVIVRMEQRFEKNTRKNGHEQVAKIVSVFLRSDHRLEPKKGPYYYLASPQRRRNRSDHPRIQTLVFGRSVAQFR